MTTPATPAKQTKTLPVRYVGVSSDIIGKGRVFWTTDAFDDLAALKCQDEYAIYTLLPPHLADEWRRLREAKAKAENLLREAINVKARFMDAAYLKWCDAMHALATFEAANGIGGGA